MTDTLVEVRPMPSLVVPWRDPHTVPRGELITYIHSLERACAEHPASADLRTLLGMAHAVNHDVPRSSEALEAAVAAAPENFWAHLKYAELQYRLRALARAEELTLTALNLATNGWQLSLARKQLLEIRTLRRSSARGLKWEGSLAGPALAASAVLIALTLAVLWA